MRLEMEDILYQNGVNIVFSGHVSFIPSIVAVLILANLCATCVR